MLNLEVHILPLFQRPILFLFFWRLDRGRIVDSRGNRYKEILEYQLLEDRVKEDEIKEVKAIGTSRQGKLRYFFFTSQYTIS